MDKCETGSEVDVADELADIGVAVAVQLLQFHRLQHEVIW